MTETPSMGLYLLPHQMHAAAAGQDHFGTWFAGAQSPRKVAVTVCRFSLVARSFYGLAENSL